MKKAGLQRGEESSGWTDNELKLGFIRFIRFILLILSKSTVTPLGPEHGAWSQEVLGG